MGVTPICLYNVMTLIFEAPRLEEEPSSLNLPRAQVPFIAQYNLDCTMIRPPKLEVMHFGQQENITPPFIRTPLSSLSLTFAAPPRLLFHVSTWPTKPRSLNAESSNATHWPNILT